MAFTVHTIPLLNDNYCYLIVCNATKKALVVDPAVSQPVINTIEKLNCSLEAILCTHHHHDHIGGIAELFDYKSNVAIYAWHSDATRIPHITNKLHHGDLVNIGNIELQVIHTPGHTTGSVCYWGNNWLFTGDTLFGGGCGRLFEASSDVMFKSLNYLTENIPDDTQIAFGHEYTIANLEFAIHFESDNLHLQKRIEQAKLKRQENAYTTPSTMELEKETNPFLRCHLNSISKNFINAKSKCEVFGKLRQAKDNW